jgi:hypothetical protein
MVTTILHRLKIVGSADVTEFNKNKSGALANLKYQHQYSKFFTSRL